MMPNSFVDALADAIVRELRGDPSTVRSPTASPARRSPPAGARFSGVGASPLSALDDRGIEAVASALVARLTAQEDPDELPLDRIEI